MKQKIQMSLDQESISGLDSVLSQHHIPRSKFVNSLIKNSIFIIKHIKDNPSHYLMEQILTDFYEMGLLTYQDLVKTLGPERSHEISQILRSTRKFKKWVNS